MKIKFELNGKGLLGIALLSSSLIFAEYVLIVDVESSGGVSVLQADESAPIGTIAMWGGTSTPPDGWLELDGSSISSEYSELISLYGNTLPDLRGEFVRGWDNGANIDTNRNLLSNQDEAVKEHKHDLYFSGYNISETNDKFRSS